MTIRLERRLEQPWWLNVAVPAGSLAVAFADAVAQDHNAISDAQVNLLLDEFTVPQIVELLIWISFEYAGQMFGCLIGDEPATAEQKRAFAAAVAAAADASASSP